jgi:phosphatidylserine decarboxylase
VLWFFRDPERTTDGAPGAFISPADGRVAEITPVGPEGPLGRDGLRIGVFMNIFSVHVNRSPCDAVVEKAEHHAGAFLDARLPEAAWKNEHATIHLAVRRDGRDWPVVVRQVAGKVARRIVTDLRPGQQLQRGERFGMIKFGSYLELTVPRELAGEVRVRLGEQVYAGRTVLIAPAAEAANPVAG